MPNGKPNFGYRFVVEPSGPSLLPEEKKQLADLRPAGIMLRKRNFLEDAPYDKWLDAYRALIDDVRKAVGRKQLLISIDHEGGRVVRPPAPITRFPYAARWSDCSGAVAAAMAVELRSLAVNTVFGPVADIHSNPSNPVINQRAFGRTPEEVLTGVLPYVEAMRAAGLLCCAKHFPGHGDTLVDSHWGLPLVDASLDELRKRELIPFAKLVAGGIPLMMTAHIVFPKIDATHTATTSKVLLDSVLRKDLGYRGVVIADALGMRAIVSSLSDEATVRDSLTAGLDLFLVAGDNLTLGQALSVERAIAKLHSAGEVPAEAIDASRTRIDALLAQSAHFEVQKLPEQVFGAHAALAAQLEARKDWEAFKLDLPGFE